MRKQRNGFSLMEMMVVLLIVAIIAAASAPMVSKKMSRDIGRGDSPWVFTGTSNSIAYNMKGDSNTSAIIGATKVPDGTQPKLYVESNGDEAQIGFGKKGSNKVISLTMDPVRGRVGFSDAEIFNDTVAFGANQSLTSSFVGITAIGNSLIAQAPFATAVGEASCAKGSNSVALGTQSYAHSNDCISIGRDSSSGMSNVPNESMRASMRAIAIGQNAKSPAENSIAIGGGNNSTNGARATGNNAIAIGNNSGASGTNSIAIGQSCSATGSSSVIIGNGISTAQSNQIMLGGPNQTVYIPGRLIVGKGVWLNVDGERPNGVDYVYLRTKGRSGWVFNDGQELNVSSGSHGITNGMYSDRRLKNVGEKFTSGLEKIKKLDVYNYTFKKDETKTPHVGVIAQDLKKIFPDAVTKGEDGYLRIRFEDMFYAVINAVKELDEKITNAFDNIANLNKRLDDQEKIIKQLQEQNKKLETRLAELEKK